MDYRQTLIAFDEGKITLNMDLSRDFMGQRCRGCMYGSWDTHLASLADFFAGADDITKERESLGSRSSNALHNL